MRQNKGKNVPREPDAVLMTVVRVSNGANHSLLRKTNLIQKSGAPIEWFLMMRDRYVGYKNKVTHDSGIELGEGRRGFV